jgi:release factor glutamine methyltransferase
MNDAAPHTLLDYLLKATDYFKSRDVESPRLCAELLLAHLLDTTRIDIYLRFEEPLSAATIDAYRELIRRRGKHEPVAYIIGKREFYGRDFLVNKDVLIPRPETEHLVEAGLAGMGDNHSARVLDVGTGSGILACTFLAEREGWSAVALDISEQALAVASENATQLNVTDRIDLRQSDLCAALDEKEKFNLIVSNPPYIRKDEWDLLPHDVSDYEPRLALYGGEGGLEVLRPLLAQATRHLETGGLFLCEIGEEQGEAVSELARESGYTSISLENDYAGKPRMLRVGL